MGFRSTFVTEDSLVAWPDWFVEKYASTINFHAEKKGSISSNAEWKTYGIWAELHKDIQKLIDWDNRENFVMVFLHECGGITRCQIEKDVIKWSEPTGWRASNWVEHDYCYGCSDA